MKFKDNAIKPGMVIHPANEDEENALLEYLESLGYRWIDDGSPANYKPDEDAESIGIRIEPEMKISWGGRKFANVEFSDLIEPYEEIEQLKKIMQNALLEIVKPEPEMSAVEVLEWLAKYRGKMESKECFGRMYDTDLLLNQFTAEEIVDKITAYEAARKEPKPVEVEWVDVCRIINGYGDILVDEVLTGSGEDIEEKAEKAVKMYSETYNDKQIHCVMERRCRVKEDEA